MAIYAVFNIAHNIYSRFSLMRQRGLLVMLVESGMAVGLYLTTAVMIVSKAAKLLVCYDDNYTTISIIL